MTSAPALQRNQPASTPGHHEPARTRAGTRASGGLRQKHQPMPAARKSTHPGKPRQHNHPHARRIYPPQYPARVPGIPWPGSPNTPAGFPEYPAGVTRNTPERFRKPRPRFRASPFRPVHACAGCAHPITLLRRQHVKRRPGPGASLRVLHPGPPGLQAHRASPLGAWGRPHRRPGDGSAERKHDDRRHAGQEPASPAEPPHGTGGTPGNARYPSAGAPPAPAGERPLTWPDRPGSRARSPR